MSLSSLFLFSLHRFKNVIFEISPSEAVGVFDVKAKFMGVHLETLQIEYQVFFFSFSCHSNISQFNLSLPVTLLNPVFSEVDSFALSVIEICRFSKRLFKKAIK